MHAKNFKSFIGNTREDLRVFFIVFRLGLLGIFFRGDIFIKGNIKVAYSRGNNVSCYIEVKKSICSMKSVK